AQATAHRALRRLSGPGRRYRLVAARRLRGGRLDRCEVAGTKQD
ncbi:MAG: hypothetical protein AVDCRST_MAG33-536, partial [uncultured Thermomicrobiales bacterium]